MNVVFVGAHQDNEGQALGTLIKSGGITGGFPIHYVIDKAPNYGNSGGPIVVCETGKAISVCVRFQPVVIPQQGIQIEIPSLYGITVSLKNIEGNLAFLG